MRLLICSFSLMMMSIAGPIYANDDSNTPELEPRIENWNQWVCVAYARGNFREFIGRSYFFRQGSGEGQQARSIAHLNALRRCEYRTGQICRSRLESDCRVRRYQSN